MISRYIVLASLLGFAAFPIRATSAEIVDPVQGSVIWLHIGGMKSDLMEELAGRFDEFYDFGFGVGFEYRSFLLEYSISRGWDDVLVSDEFIGQTIYPREAYRSFAIMHSAKVLYRFRLSKYFSALPLFDLRWHLLREAHFDYDPHPNWDLNANSNARPFVGLRLEAVQRVDNVSFGYAIGYSTGVLKFNNPEYGQGRIWELSILFILGIAL